jgi:hypothetical protein
VAIVKRVHEIERDVAGDEIEARRAPSRDC